MNRFALSLFAATLALATLLPSAPADAASAYMCAPQRAGAATGPARQTFNSTAYSLNARGCAMVAVADIGAAVAAGFISQAPFQTIVTSGIITSASGNFFDLPAGAYIQSITVEETSGLGISGGVKFGTSNGGGQVLAALGVNASGVNTTSGLLRNSFSGTAATRIYLDCALSCVLNNTSLDVTVVYGLFK